MVAVDIQLSASHVDWPTLRRASLVAEERGFDALWTLDHLAGQPMGGTTALECFAWLGALAEATSTITLGVLVANTWNRQLGTLAVAASSVTAISGRPFLLGIGAGASPSTRWAEEQHAVGAEIHADVAVRHQRVERFLALTDEMWRADRGERFATFPRAQPPPMRIVGVNSVELAEIAGAHADGINVGWDHPRREEFLAAAERTAAGRQFVTTAWAAWTSELLDPAHPTRRAMDDRGIDRLILTVTDDLADFR